MSGWYIDDENLNELQQNSLRDFLSVHSTGAKFIDLHCRKDGVERHYEADYLKHFQRIEEDINDHVRVTSADYNGHSCDGPPFEPMTQWMRFAIIDGRITVEPTDTDYAVWKVPTKYGDKIAEPGDLIFKDGDSFLVFRHTLAR